MNIGRIGLAALCLLIAICNGACTGNKVSKDKTAGEQTEVNHNLRFVSYSYDMIAEDSKNQNENLPGSNYIRVTGEGILPLALGNDNIKQLRDSLQNLAAITFLQDGNPMPVLPVGYTITNLLPSNTESCGNISSRMGASLVNPRVVVFDHVAGVYECGAAHGMKTLTSVNYCIDEGRILDLHDIIKKDSEESLVKLIRNDLALQQIALNTELEDIIIPKEFIIEAHGIDFIYQPYEIAPYSEGIIHATVDLNELMTGGLLTAEGEFIFNGTPVPASYR